MSEMQSISEHAQKSKRFLAYRLKQWYATKFEQLKFLTPKFCFLNQQYCKILEPFRLVGILFACNTIFIANKMRTGTD